MNLPCPQDGLCLGFLNKGQFVVKGWTHQVELGRRRVVPQEEAAKGEDRRVYTFGTSGCFPVFPSRTLIRL